MPGPQEQENVNQGNILFANMKQQVDNMITQCQQTNTIMLEHMQNAVVITHDQNTKANDLWYLRASDSARLAREMEVGESVANRLIGMVGKLPDPDYLLAIAKLAEILKTSQATS